MENPGEIDGLKEVTETERGKAVERLKHGGVRIVTLGRWEIGALSEGCGVGSGQQSTEG